ncbi:pectinesterase [Ranunculus cassubicifolius]
MGKAAAAVISLILVVGAVIGTVVVVKQHNKNGSTAATGGSGMSTGMKAVETLCTPAYHPDLCRETLTPLVKSNGNVSPKAFLEASFQAVLKAVNQAMIESKSLDKDVKNKFDATSLEVCKKYIDYMAEDLEMAINKVSESDMTYMGDFARELNIFLSAVLSYKATCVEEMENLKLKEALQGGVLLNTTKLAENGMDIVDGVAQFLGVTYEVDSDDEDESTEGKPNRRLLDVGEDGYPTWLSASDRKLLQVKENPLPHVVVSKDGSGQFTTIQEAINSYPAKHKGRYVIYVKEGVYEGNVTMSHKNVYMYGDGPTKTIVTDKLNYKLMHIQTSQTATFAALGHGFMAKSMGFHNTAGPEGDQAVALLTKSNHSIYHDCIFDGYQDTLYYQAHQSFFHNCSIYGTIDFIFGRGTALIQKSTIVAKMPLANQQNIVAADGSVSAKNATGLVIQNCKIMGEPTLIANKNIRTYLARPWGNCSKTIFMESYIPDIIRPEGYLPWNITHPNNLTSEFREYNNRGPGANTAGRVQWPSFKLVTNKHLAKNYTTGHWLPRSNKWLKDVGFLYDKSFTAPGDLLV